MRHALAVLALLAALMGGSARAQDDDLTALRAGFLLNFAKLTTWPAQRIDSSSSALTLCLLKDDPEAAGIRRALDGKRADDHPVQVELVGAEDKAAVRRCHLFYAGSTLQARYAQIFPQFAAAGALIIDEGSRFTWPDGMIRLYLDDGRFRFEINEDSIDKAHLRLDPRVVRLARIATR